MSTNAGESGALNPYGDLSRRARRELEDSGVNPEQARDELLSTGAIRLPTGSILTADSASTSPGLSRREVRSIVERTEFSAAAESSPLFDATVRPGSPLERPTFTLPSSPGVPIAPVEQVVSSATTPLDEMIAQRLAERPAQKPADQAADRRSERAVERTPADPFARSTESTGVVSTTSHALIIPSPPDPLSGPIISLDQTGEVLLTGQIVLPASIGVTGADSGRLDLAEVDVVDYGTEITPSQDLAPVRATSAVSATVTRGGAVTSPIKSRDRVPLALTVTATILAVAVVGLFVAGYLLGVF